MTDQKACPAPALDRTATTAQLNDSLRQNLIHPGHNRVVMTRGVQELIGDISLFRNFQARAELLRAICDYDAFGPDMNPHGERDFGRFEFCGAALYWKIDLYEGQFVKAHSFIIAGRSAFLVPRRIDAQSAHRLVSGRDHCPAPQSVFTSLDRAKADADQTITGRFSGAINLPGHTSHQPALPIKPVATLASGRAELGTLRNQTGFHKAPKGNQEFSRQGDDADFRRTLSTPFVSVTIPTSVAVQPCKGSFNDPASRQEHKAFCGIRAFDNLKAPRADFGQRILELVPGITAVGKDMPQEREALTDILEHQRCATAILNIGGVDHGVNEVAAGVGQDMAFARLDLLATHRSSEYRRFSVVVTLWLSITPALGDASRPSATRKSISR